MNKICTYKREIIITVVTIGAIILAGWYFFGNTPRNQGKISTPFNATYRINGESFTLHDGHVEKQIVPDSATLNKVSIFGAPSFGDIDKDGDDDALLILINKPGGSGTFYYAAIAANIDGKYQGTDTILLGDRIAPQTFDIRDNKAIINYMVRNAGEDFSVQPSMGKSLRVQFDPETFNLIEVMTNFEGEADPNIMTLGMNKWRWIKTIYNDDTEVTPNDADAFTLTFSGDNKFNATTDCNSMFGTYETQDNTITFGNIASTKMYCEGSQELDFESMLSETQSYLFTNRGELILELKSDTGSVIFR